MTPQAVLLNVLTSRSCDVTCRRKLIDHYLPFLSRVHLSHTSYNTVAVIKSFCRCNHDEAYHWQIQEFQRRWIIGIGSSSQWSPETVAPGVNRSKPSVKRGLRRCPQKLNELTHLIANTA